MPVQIKAWSCQFKCGRNVVTSRKAMEKHEQFCFHNPARKACCTCLFLKYEKDDNGMDGAYREEWENIDCESPAHHDIQSKLRHDCADWKGKPV